MYIPVSIEIFLQAATVQRYHQVDIGKITKPKIIPPKCRDAAKDDKKIAAEEVKKKKILFSGY